MTEEPKPKHGIWSPVPPKVRLLILATVLNGLAFGYLLIYVMAFLPEVGVSPAVVGAIFGVEGLALILAGIPFAMLSDLKGRKWFVIAGNLIFAPTIIAFGLSRDINVLYVAAAIGGVGEAMGLSSWNALIADETDLTNRDSAFSLSFVVGTASFSIGSALPLSFGWIAAMTGLDTVAVHSWAFLVIGAASFGSPVALWFLLRDYKEKVHSQKTQGLKLGGMGQTLRFSLINSIIGFGAGLIIPLIGTWLWLKFSVPDAYSGPYLALAGLTIAFSAVASPRISKSIGLFPAIVATAGSSTLFMLSLAFVPNVFLAGGLYLVRAGLMNMNAPLMDSFLMGITSPQRRGLASTLNAIIWRIPNTGSTFIGGIVLASGTFDVPALGLSHLDLPWVLAAGLYALGIGLLYTNFRKIKPTM
ncbi:MAG: MFS transporter [Thaumarchaeota archaeon]|nr:MFS transporter [Nitrososphaerota archaeon]